ncbi:Retron-type reverse transcriptase [Paramagnetospirillum magneticum AMB-1]|uniref:Retron-type reverse transcriptase n=2 Tax=Paramagnetospirillum magneticum TaxID=84159 RepID=Q2WA61_PARM1|nr:Retron-type reverse transcriptase [Paramagnetospirillum magneticum AMB-1]
MLEGQGLPACAHHLVGVAAASMQLVVAPGAIVDTAGAPPRVPAQLGRRRCLRQSPARPVHPRQIRLGVGPELQQRQPEQQQGLERPGPGRPQMIIQQPSEITVAQLFEAYYECRRHKRTTRSALAFEVALEANLMQLLTELRAGTWWPAPATVFAITRPKPREVWAAQFRDRIVHHLVYRAINPLFEPAFIADSCACIKGRGTLYAADRLERHLRSVTEGWSKPAYYLKADIANFFGSIRHDVLFAMLARRIADPTMLELCRRLVFQDVRQGAIVQDAAGTLARVPSHKSLFQTPAGIGLPIGNLSSQFFANVYLDPVDQMVKRRLKLRYVRYVDDMVIVHQDPKVLLAAADAIRAHLSGLGLHLAESKTFVAPVEKGVDFVGHVIRPHRRSARPKTHRVALARISTMPKAEVPDSATSYLGLFRHSGSRAQIAAVARVAVRRGFRVDRELTKVVVKRKVSKK